VYYDVVYVHALQRIYLLETLLPLGHISRSLYLFSHSHLFD